MRVLLKLLVQRDKFKEANINSDQCIYLRILLIKVSFLRRLRSIRFLKDSLYESKLVVVVVVVVAAAAAVVVVVVVGASSK